MEIASTTEQEDWGVVERFKDTSYSNFLDRNRNFVRTIPALFDAQGCFRDNLEGLIGQVSKAEDASAAHQDWVERLNTSHGDLVLATKENDRLQAELLTALRRLNVAQSELCKAIIELGDKLYDVRQ